MYIISFLLVAKRLLLLASLVVLHVWVECHASPT